MFSYYLGGDPYLAGPGLKYSWDFAMLFCMTYITGTKQKIVNTHEETANCSKYGCSIHNPSDHNMKNWPTHWRDDRAMMERICEHGVGHPDPDHINWVSRNVGPRAASVVSIHGCDGCCRKENNEER